MKKVLVKGPALSDSEYGLLCREVLLELLQNNNIDLYLLNTNWGNSGWIIDSDELRDSVDQLIMKTSSYVTNDKNPKFDISLQVDRPTGWMRMADRNIGITNEPSTVNMPEFWNPALDSIDRIIVSSESRRASFPEKYLEKISVIERRLSDKVESTDNNLELSTEYNFLVSCKWETKNNIEQTITSFLQEFQNEPVGLILDTFIKNKSLIDREYAYEHLNDLISLFPKNRKCKVFFLHGERPDDIVFGEESVGAYIDLRHTMEHDSGTYKAISHGIPVISCNWGTMSNVSSELYHMVDNSINNLKERHIYNSDTSLLELSWSYPTMDSVRSALREAYQKGLSRDFKLYEELNKNINQNENMSYNKLINNLMENKDETK